MLSLSNPLAKVHLFAFHVLLMLFNSGPSITNADEALQIEVHLVPLNLKRGTSVAISVAIRNELEHSITQLTCVTTIDPKAGMPGILKGQDVDAKYTYGGIVQLNRKLPPPRESLLEVDGKE